MPLEKQYSNEINCKYSVLLLYTCYIRDSLFYCYCNAQGLTNISSHSSTSVSRIEIFWTQWVHLEIKITWSVAQYPTFRILLYPQKDVYALRGIWY